MNPARRTQIALKEQEIAYAQQQLGWFKAVLVCEERDVRAALHKENVEGADVIACDTDAQLRSAINSIVFHRELQRKGNRCALLTDKDSSKFGYRCETEEHQCAARAFATANGYTLEGVHSKDGRLIGYSFVFTWA